MQERKEFHTVVIRATEMCKAKQSSSRTFTKKSVKAFLKPLKFKSLRIPKNVRMVAYVGFKSEKEMKQALQKDKSFLGLWHSRSCNLQSFLKVPDLQIHGYFATNLEF